MRKAICTLAMGAILIGMTSPAAFAEESMQLTYAQALDRALSHSYSLKNASLDIERAKEVREESEDKVDYAPSSSGNLAASRAFTGLVQADINLNMAKKNQGILEDSLTYNVQKSYNAVIQAKEQIKLTELALKNAQWQRRLVGVKYNFGLASAVERDAEQSNYKVAEANYLLAQKAYDDAFQGFATLVDLHSDESPVLVDMPVVNAEGIIELETQVSRVLTASPSSWKADQNVTLAKLDVDLFEFNTGSVVTYEAKKIDLEKKKLDAADTREQLEKTVRNLYYALKQLEDQYATSQANLATAENNLKVVKVKHDIGMATDADLVAAELGVQKVQRELVDIAARHENYRMAYEKPWAYGGS